jgi:hypothetical protein
MLLSLCRERPPTLAMLPFQTKPQSSKSTVSIILTRSPKIPCGTMPYMPVVVDFVWPRSIPNCSSRYSARRKASANVRNQQLHNFPLPSVLSVGESGFCSLIQREIHPSHHVRSINSLWSNHSAKLPSAERYLLIVFCAIAGLPSEAFASITFRNDRPSNALMSAALEGHSASLCFPNRFATNA